MFTSKECQKHQESDNALECLDCPLVAREREGDLPDKVLRSNDAGGDCVAEGVQLNSLVRLKVFLAEEDVEIGVLLDRHVDLVGVFWTNSGSIFRCLIIDSGDHCLNFVAFLKCSWLVELAQLCCQRK